MCEMLEQTVCPGPSGALQQGRGEEGMERGRKSALAVLLKSLILVKLSINYLFPSLYPDVTPSCFLARPPRNPGSKTCPLPADEFGVWVSNEAHPCSSKVREGILVRSPYERTPVPTLSLHSCPPREEHPGKQKQITEMQPAGGLRAVEGETASYPTLSLKTRRDGDVKETLSRCPLSLCSALYARRVWTLWTAVGMWLSHGGVSHLKHS